MPARRNHQPQVPFTYKLVLNQWLFSLFGLPSNDGRFAWNGKPKRLATGEEADRSPLITNVAWLASYEDTLNNLENLRQPDDIWKVRLIEDDFHRLMFEADDPMPNAGL